MTEISAAAVMAWPRAVSGKSCSDAKRPFLGVSSLNLGEAATSPIFSSCNLGLENWACCDELQSRHVGFRHNDFCCHAIGELQCQRFDRLNGAECFRRLGAKRTSAILHPASLAHRKCGEAVHCRSIHESEGCNA